MNVNVNLMEGNVIQINSGITINVDVSVKNVMYVKRLKKKFFWNCFKNLMFNVVAKM